MADQRVQEMHRLYCEGEPLEAVGRRYQLSRERVRQLFRDADLPTRSRGEAARLKTESARGRKEALVQRMRETGDVEFVAAEFDVPVDKARSIVKQSSPDLLSPVHRKGDRVPMGFWTRSRVLEAIQRWNDLYGKPPSASDWNPAVARRLGHMDRLARFDEGLWPHVNTVQTIFEKWNEGIRAAGFEPTRTGSYGRPGDDPDVVASAVGRYRDGSSLGAAASSVGISRATLTRALVTEGLPLPGERLVERIKVFLRDRDWTPAKTLTYALPDASVHVYAALNELRRDPEVEFLEMAGRGVFVRFRREPGRKKLRRLN